MILQAVAPARGVTAITPTATLQQIDPAASYRLTNDYAGPGKSLTVVNKNNVFELAMSDTRPGDGNQQWKFVSVGNNKYRLTSLALGPAKSLDTPKSGETYLIRMQATGDYTGQWWTLTSVGNGRVRLVNDYATPSMSLDTPMSGNQYIVVMAGTGSYSGQMWTLTKTDGAIAINVPNQVQGQPTLQSPTINVPINVIGNVPVSQPPGGGSTSSGTLVTGGGPLTPNAQPLTVTGVPPGVPALSNSKGQALCIKGGAVFCGDTKADWVGSHTLNMKCERGFYDPIWGGTCWEAPDAGDRGAWIRSTTAVTKPDAFWRIPSTKLASAVKVQGNTPFAWNCPSGSFWDGYNGGACWKCPDDYPRRTAYHVAENKACATSADKQDATAVFVKYNGCPTPNASQMNLPGKRTAGRPFLQIGSGCYTCPTTDEEGNILITERNVKPITGDSYNNNTGCTILMKWKPAQFIEPGIAGIEGFRPALDETLAFATSEVLTFYFLNIAKGKGYAPGSAQSKQQIAQMWNSVETNPTKSVELSTLMYGYLERAISTEASKRTPAQTAFLKGFSDYVTRRRTFIAEQALAMYDAWKAAEPQLRATVAQSQLQTLFYYGTVPLDFESATAAGLGLASAGLGTVAAVAAYNVHWATTLQVANAARTAAVEAGTKVGIAVQSAVRSQTLYSAFASLSNFRLLALGSQIVTTAGPLAIAAAGSIILSIAIDQVVEIATARDRLLNGVEVAKQQADLEQLIKQADGRDQLAYFWAKAVDGTSALDTQLRAQAVRLAEEARTKNYEIPLDTPAPAAPAAPPATSLPLASLVTEYQAATNGINVAPAPSGFNGVWGLDANGAIKRMASPDQWAPVGGGLSQIAAGFDNSVFGVNASGQIWQWTGATWQLLSGGAVKVSVQSANRIAAVNGAGEVWTYDGTRWTGIAAPKMKDIAIGIDGYLFAVGEGGEIYRSSGPVANAGSAGWTWDKLPGGGSKIAAGNKDLALTVNGANELWLWKSGTWTKIGDNFIDVAMSKNTIWGLKSNHALVRMDARGWMTVPSEGLVRFAAAWSAN